MIDARVWIATVFFVFSGAWVFAQEEEAEEEQATATVPDSEIHLAQLEWDRGGVHVLESRNVTNRAGYDSQPYFLPDSSGFLFASIGDDGQADVYSYDLSSGAVARLTDTPESEFSPTPMTDGGFSTVRVEMDQAQRLWAYDNDGEARLLLPGALGVGYNAWVDPETVVMFIVVDPPLLVGTTLGDQTLKKLAGTIGRSLAPVPIRETASFVDKTDENLWWISEVDVDSRTITPLVPTIPGREDYAWAPDGSLLMASGTELFRWSGGDEWNRIADLADEVDGEIGRLAVSPDGRWLAFVTTPVVEQ